jgi:hypothetical protein
MDDNTLFLSMKGPENQALKIMNERLPVGLRSLGGMSEG